MRLAHCVSLQLVGRKAGGKDLEEIAALGTTMGKLGDVLLNAAAGLLSAPNAKQVGRSLFLLAACPAALSVSAAVWAQPGLSLHHFATAGSLLVSV